MGSSLLPRIETALIILMCLGFLLIAQEVSFALYRIGMLTVIGATILNIAVSNIPRRHRSWRALGTFLVIIAVTLALFGIGIVLTPYLARMGQ